MHNTWILHITVQSRKISRFLQKLLIANKYCFLNLHIMDLKKEFERFIHTFLDHHHHSWGTIVLSRERTERSRTIPSFRKKNEHIERVLKIVGTICKGTERTFLKRSFEIRNAFLLSRTRYKSGTHFKSGMFSKLSRNN